MTRPANDTPILIPIFFNVAPYLVKRNGDDTALDWAEGYAGRDGGVVRSLRDGLLRAARGGVEAEYMVVDYAAGARFFGPFRLVPGDRLTPEEKGHNDLTLEALGAHLRQPPLSAWRARRAGDWVSDVTGPLHTLNDLYFRTFPGLVGALLVTECLDNPTTQLPIVQSDLWVERLEQINEALSRERIASVLEALDEGRSMHDEAITGPQAIADERSPAEAGWREEDRRLQMDALLVPGPASIDLGMLRKFEQLIDERFGGEVYRVYRVRMTPQEQLEEVLRGGSRFDDTKSVGQMIRTVYDQLRGSYVVTAEIPNETPDGTQYPLTFKVEEAQRSGKGKIKYRAIDGRLRYLPSYTSSRTIREKLSALAGSPFRLLRLLTAYEIRNYWNDPSLASLVQARLAAESDREIRRVLFESAVVQNLKRLQATPREIPDAGDRSDSIQGAYRRLRNWADEADRVPDPLLAREAARVAFRYRQEFPDRFDGP